MGQKVHPKIFRMKINKTWDAKWFADADFSDFLRQDVQIRRYITHKWTTAGISRVEIERAANALTINIYCAKPGVLIGRGGQGAEDLKKEVHNKFVKDGFSRRKGLKNVNVNILEVSKAGLDAGLAVQLIAADLEKRIPFRRVVKQAAGRIEKAGAQGVKISVAGRLNGAEIARTETIANGKIPLHTLRADIDYNRGAAQTIYGKIGIKVWIYRGEVFASENNNNNNQDSDRSKERPRRTRS